MGKLLYFLSEVTHDPQKRIAFIKDSNAVMDAAGLSGPQKKAVRSKDVDEVMKLLKQEFTEPHAIRAMW